MTAVFPGLLDSAVLAELRERVERLEKHLGLLPPGATAVATRQPDGSIATAVADELAADLALNAIVIDATHDFEQRPDGAGEILPRDQQNDTSEATGAAAHLSAAERGIRVGRRVEVPTSYGTRIGVIRWVDDDKERCGVDVGSILFDYTFDELGDLEPAGGVR